MNISKLQGSTIKSVVSKSKVRFPRFLFLLVFRRAYQQSGEHLLLPQREQPHPPPVHPQRAGRPLFPPPKLRNRQNVRIPPFFSSSIPELTGLLTELYLLATTCLPASSLLLQRDPTRGIAPAHKLLIEILFFQLFTFPLLAWPEVRPVLTRLLTRTLFLLLLLPAEPAAAEIPPRITAVLAVFYFLYENSQLNTAESGPSLCDRTQQLSLQTRFLPHRELRDIAADLAISADRLKQYGFFLRLVQDCRANLRGLGRGPVARVASVASVVFVARVPAVAAVSARASARLRRSEREP